MYLIDHLAAGQLMQSVYVLGDDAVKLSLCLHLGQFVMGLVGLNAARVHFLAVELVEHLGLALQAGIAQQIFGLIGVKPHIVLVVEAVLAAEIRDSALCRNAGTAEKDDML